MTMDLAIRTQLNWLLDQRFWTESVRHKNFYKKKKSAFGPIDFYKELLIGSRSFGSLFDERF